MQTNGLYDDVNKAFQLLDEQILDAETRDDHERVANLKALKVALEKGRMLTMQEAQDYLSIFGCPVRSRSSFYKFTEVTHSIPYEDLNPSGTNRVRLFNREVLDLFIKHRHAFKNSKEEIQHLLSLDRLERQEKSLEMGIQKLKKLKEQLANVQG